MDSEYEFFIGVGGFLIIIVASIIGGMAFYHTIDTDAKMKLYCIQHGKGVEVDYNRQGAAYVQGCK
jgi:hypothetical protein